MRMELLLTLLSPVMDGSTHSKLTSNSVIYNKSTQSLSSLHQRVRKKPAIPSQKDGSFSRRTTPVSSLSRLTLNKILTLPEIRVSLRFLTSNFGTKTSQDMTVTDPTGLISRLKSLQLSLRLSPTLVSSMKSSMRQRLTRLLRSLLVKSLNSSAMILMKRKPNKTI